MDEINNNMIQLYASLNKLSLNRMIEKVSNFKKKTHTTKTQMKSNLKCLCYCQSTFQSKENYEGKRET